MILMIVLGGRTNKERYRLSKESRTHGILIKLQVFILPIDGG